MSDPELSSDDDLATDDGITATEAPAEEARSEMAASLAWMAPSHCAPPTEALLRIKAICDMAGDDLHCAMLMVLATHQAVPRNILAIALKQMRRDLAPYSQDDVIGLLTAVWNGGSQGFQSVLRTRKTGERKNISLSWLPPDN